MRVAMPTDDAALLAEAGALVREWPTTYSEGDAFTVEYVVMFDHAPGLIRALAVRLRAVLAEREKYQLEAAVQYEVNIALRAQVVADHARCVCRLNDDRRLNDDHCRLCGHYSYTANVDRTWPCSVRVRLGIGEEK